MSEEFTPVKAAPGGSVMLCVQGFEHEGYLDPKCPSCGVQDG